MHSHTPDSSCSCRPIISLRDVSMIHEHREVLRDVNLDILPHDFIAITGPNGGGKSTLLHIILKLLTPSRGSVTYLDDKGSPTPRLHIGYLPQKNMIDSRFPITVSEVVASGLLNTFTPRDANHEVLLEETLRELELTSHASASIGTLSGGQLQRALLGRAIISQPRVLVLDEPLSYLDKRFEERTYEILRRLAPSTTIILVSHEMTAIAPMATRHFIVDRTLRECGASCHYASTSCDI